MTITVKYENGINSMNLLNYSDQYSNCHVIPICQQNYELTYHNYDTYAFFDEKYILLNKLKNISPTGLNNLYRLYLIECLLNYFDVLAGRKYCMFRWKIYFKLIAEN